MNHGIFVNCKAGGNNIRSCYCTVHKLFCCPDCCADDLRFSIKTIVLIDRYDILNVLSAVFAVCFFPSNERRNEEGAVLCRKDCLRCGEYQCYIRSDPFCFQSFCCRDPGRNAGDLYYKVFRDRRNLSCCLHHFVCIFQIRIDLNRNRKLLITFQPFFFDPLRNIRDRCKERLSGIHDVTGICGHSIDPETVIGFFDLI